MTKTFSRQELYDLVWETPVSILSQELGISDRGLAKICNRNKIPTPSRGYWARIRSGAVIEQRALPKLDKEEKPIVIEPCEAQARTGLFVSETNSVYIKPNGRICSP